MHASYIIIINIIKKTSALCCVPKREQGRKKLILPCTPPSPLLMAKQKIIVIIIIMAIMINNFNPSQVRNAHGGSCCCICPWMNARNAHENVGGMHARILLFVVHCLALLLYYGYKNVHMIMNWYENGNDLFHTTQPYTHMFQQHQNNHSCSPLS